jgi:hypothetical protein
VKRALLIALVACGSKDADKQPPAPDPAPPPAPPPIDRASLIAGKLPDAPEMEVVNAQCRICHSLDYLTQQRLTDAGWKKAIDKMRKFGANLSDADAAALVTFVAKHWNRELGDREFTLVALPPGATPP